MSICKKRITIDNFNRSPISCSPQNNKAVLCMAAENGHTEVVKALLSHPNINADWQDCSGQTALMAACAGGHCSTVCALVAHRGLQLHLQDLVTQPSFRSSTQLLSIATQSYYFSVVQKGNTAAMIALEKSDQSSDNAVIMAAKGNPLDTKNAVCMFFPVGKAQPLFNFNTQNVLFRPDKPCCTSPARRSSTTTTTT